MLNRLFGRRQTGDATAAAGLGEIAARERHAGYEILARPIHEGGTWRIAGSVCRGSGEDADQHDFVRADTVADHSEAVQLSLLKARQLIDDRGEALFRHTSP